MPPEGSALLAATPSVVGLAPFEREQLVATIPPTHAGSLAVIGPDSNLREILADADSVMRAALMTILNGGCDPETIAKLQIDHVPEFIRVLARIGTAGGGAKTR